MIGGNTKNKQSGFTLIEVLVSAAVFVVVVSMGAVLFITISNAQKKAVNQEKIVRDVRVTMETISRMSRMYTVSYESYADAGIDDLSQGVNILYLEAGSGDIVSFQEVDGQVFMNRHGLDTEVTSGDVTIDRLYFYISPLAADELAKNPQRVTIVMGASREGERGAADEVNLETSVTARWYGGGGILSAP